jgi:glycosyltransferase involved in cell wall biosynthesis
MVTRKQARVLPGSGVDLDRFRPAVLSDGPPVFLFVGRLLCDKGVIEFVEAARHLRQSRPTLRFQLLGPIDEENRTSVLRNEIRHWEKDGIIEYLGECDDVRPFIAAATAVVLPSYREGLPRSLLEAGAMARPLIATDVPGCRDVVEDGVNGYLCNARDASSLASVIERFALLSHEQRLQMATAARAKVQDRFSEEYVIRAYLDVFAELH